MYKPNSGLHSKVEQHLPWLSPCCTGARVGGQALRPLLTWTADSPSPLLTNGHLLLTPLGELKGQKVLSALIGLLYRCSKLTAPPPGWPPGPSLTSMNTPLDGHLQFHRIPLAHCQWETVPSHPLSSTLCHG